jgi:hypothetical protein
MKQNRSHAIMAQRFEAEDSLDDFPTPPWATRALIEHVIGPSLNSQTCLEPACGRGHMAIALAPYFRKVVATDICDYGYGQVSDFLSATHADKSFDWVITNPPFRLAEDFIYRALRVARRGVSMLTRTVFLESVGRYERLFKLNAPSRCAQFVERVPMIRGRIDKDASTATGYAWLVWEKEKLGQCKLIWIPPCRKALERADDYWQQPKARSNVKRMPFASCN